MIYVYTSISNAFDNVRAPEVVSPNARYVCFTNLPNLPRVEPWEYRPLHNLGDAGRTNRVPKILPHLMLPSDAEYSIYHDGNFQLKMLPEVIIDQLLTGEDCGYDWAAHRHPCRNCIYDEAIVLLKENIGTRELVENDVLRYRNAGYPTGAGLWANGMIVRRHTESVKRLCEDWWTAYATGCERDQMSFPPVRRQHGVEVNTIDADIYINSDKSAKGTPYLNFHFHAPWKTTPSNREYHGERAIIREQLARLTELTGKNGLECPEF